MSSYSFIANAHPNYIENLYERYRINPEEIDPSWSAFFKGYEYGSETNGKPAESPNLSTKEFQVLSMIIGFRNRGHLLSTTNPIKARRDRRPNLSIEDFGLSEADMDTRFLAGKETGRPNAMLREIISHLRQVYCGNIGFEFHHIQDREKRRWIREKIEKHHPDTTFDIPLEKKRRILEKLNGAEVFEKFLHTKYVGQKRFSIEGGETAIPALDAIINRGVEGRVEEVVIGMAHRGRLNVLANILGKTYDQIFNEFEGNVVPDLSFGDGDVKYHLGYSSQVMTPSGKSVYLKLTPNPSHLEAVDPVVQGYSRAKADILYESEYDRILPILIHGDAAVAGQGVVYETVQMSGLNGYSCGGTIHLVINNQIGFTTDFDDARTSTYCTGVANVVQAPVFHVNGDDPEAVLFAAEFAIEYRQEFNSDVFIDMVCYRKHGHNEGDDPQFTNPDLYDLIKYHPTPREIYSKKLADRGDVDKKIADDLEKEFWNQLQERLELVKQKSLTYTYQEPEQSWRQLNKTTTAADFEKSPETGVDLEMLNKILNHLITTPSTFSPLAKAKRLLKNTTDQIKADSLDWALGELLAYGTLLTEGHDIRMSGQDVKRGTFSHRHAIFRDSNTYEEYRRLDHIAEGQGKFRIFNSLLSEFGVLGFEYGYSLATPHTLVIWEAQFGDFANGAQTIFDQFISAGQTKWQRMSGLVMLLPHGYEGQGPEHSSARMERYLQSCAECNVVVANVTTPANFFHLLRRQLAWPFRKPLVVMSPKSLLRHPECRSALADFGPGKAFQEVIDDDAIGAKGNKKVQRIVFCSGKLYFELLEKKKIQKINHVALVRIEQLYPFPQKSIQPILEKFKQAECYWVQEEPKNMGAWRFIRDAFEDNFDIRLNFIGRKSSASPATGFKKVHDKQQEDIVTQALNW